MAFDPAETALAPGQMGLGIGRTDSLVLVYACNHDDETLAHWLLPPATARQLAKQLQDLADEAEANALRLAGKVN